MNWPSRVSNICLCLFEVMCSHDFYCLKVDEGGALIKMEMKRE